MPIDRYLSLKDATRIAVAACDALMAATTGGGIGTYDGLSKELQAVYMFEAFVVVIGVRDRVDVDGAVRGRDEPPEPWDKLFCDIIRSLEPSIDPKERYNREKP